MKQYIIFSGFVLMVILQWIVPARMIFQKEKILVTGKEFRFRTEPVDPYDAFRGKYIHLAFNETFIQVKDSVDWIQGDQVYASLATDSIGFAKITGVTKVKPTAGEDFIKVMVNYVYNDSISTVNITYPFDRFYMEESKAVAADRAYSEAMRDSSQVTYALVRIQDGEGVIQDVFIDGKPIREVAMQRQKEEEQQLSQ